MKTGYIYTIRSNQSPLFYIGSTISPLHKRLYQHKSKYKLYNNNGSGNYFTSFDIMKYDDAYIELLEVFEFNNKLELTKREGELIRDNIDKCINKKIEGRKNKQYYEDNKEHILEMIKEYRTDNKEHISDNKKEYYENNKEIICNKIKNYRKDNKELMASRDKQKYDKNREKILKQKKEYYMKKKLLRNTPPTND